MADPDGVLDALRSRRGSRPTRTAPPKRTADGEPRRPPLSRVGADAMDQGVRGSAAAAPALAPRSDDDEGETGAWGTGPEVPSASAASAAPAATPAAPPAELPGPAVAPTLARAVQDPAPVPAAADTRGPVNVHARIQAPDNDRLERIMRQLRRMGWPTNKVEIIGMLVHELPEPADEALAERLLAYRRDIINATEG